MAAPAVGHVRAQVLELLEESLPPGWIIGRRELEDRQHEQPVDLGIQWITVAVPDPVDGPQRRGQEHRNVQRLGDNSAESGDGPLDHRLPLGGRADGCGQAVAFLECPVAQSSNVVDARHAGDLSRSAELLRHRFGLGDERPDGSVGNDPGGQPGKRPAQPPKSRHHQAGTLGFPGGNLISLASLVFVERDHGAWGLSCRQESNGMSLPAGAARPGSSYQKRPAAAGSSSIHVTLGAPDWSSDAGKSAVIGPFRARATTSAL